MKKRVVVGLAALLNLFGPPLGCIDDEPEGAANGAPQPGDADEAAIQALLERQLTAWADGDGATFAATYTADGDLTAFDGTHVAGRDQIASFMQPQFDGILKGTRVAAQPKKVRFIGDDAAVMITEGGVMFPDEVEVPPERLSIQTFVVVRLDEGWLFTAFQNTRILPTP